MYKKDVAIDRIVVIWCGGMLLIATCVRRKVSASMSSPA